MLRWCVEAGSESNCSESSLHVFTLSLHSLRLGTKDRCLAF